MQGEEVQRIFDTKVRETFGGRYEYRRWFETPLKQTAYEMTKKTILWASSSARFNHYLEVGPGPGTWTKLFVEKNRKAEFHLIEISDEMIFTLKENIGHIEHLRITHGDFLEFMPDKAYDFFFSSRAIEYMDDKKALIAQIQKTLAPGKTGLIITKTPKYRRMKILGRKASPLHSGQIEPKKLAELLSSVGFTKLRVFPVVLYFPLLRIPLMDKMLFAIFGKKKLNFLSSFFSESYGISFTRS